MPPVRLQRMQRYLQRVITRRAQWRLDHGVAVPRVKCIVRFNGGIIPIWRLFGQPSESLVDISPDAIQRKPPKFLRFTGRERFPVAIELARGLTLLTFLALFAYDWMETARAKAANLFHKGLGGTFGRTSREPGVSAMEEK